MSIKNIANILTISRMTFSILILPTSLFSFCFYILYTICGITDIVDGTVARKTHTESRNGARLDSIADIVFLLVVLLKLLPVLTGLIPQWVLLAVIGTAIIRLLAYAIGATKFHKFTALHTILNKITGAALFCIPYVFLKVDISVICFVVCILAGISAVEEFMINIKSKDFNPDIKSIFKG